LDVIVTDAAGKAIPEARVELRLGSQLTGDGFTDSSGKLRLALDHPGDYRLLVQKAGFFPMELSLPAPATGAVQNVDLVLPKAVVNQQQVEVEAAAASPVEEVPTSQETLSAAQVKETPSKPATLTDVLPLVPGIVRARDGTVRIAGYGENHSAMLVNSVNVTDPATGEFGLTVPIDSVETVSVSEMPYLAQYGKFTAGVVTAETRRGDDKWKFSLNDPLPEFRIRSDHLEGLRTATPRFNLSGPLVAGKLYFLTGTEYLLNKQEVRTLPFPWNETRSTAVNSFTQVDAILSPKHLLTVSLHMAPHRNTYSGLDFFNPQPVTPNADFHESTAALSDRLALGEGTLQSTLAMTRVSTGVHPQGPADMVLAPEGNTGNYFSSQARLARRVEWIENWAPGRLHFWGEHSLQVGSVVGHSTNEGRFQARPALIEDASGRLLSRIDFTGGGAFQVADTEPAVYFQDHWVWNSHFAVDVGVRLEGQTITDTVRSAPRGGFAWSPGKTGSMIVRGGMGVFYDYVPLNVYAFSTYPEQVLTNYGVDGTAGAPIPYVNLTQQAAQSRFPFVDRGHISGNFAPYSVAGNLEVQQTVAHGLVLQSRYLQSAAEGTLMIQPQIVQGINALVLGSGGAARTRQLELTARLGGEQKRQLFFSYVRQHARGDLGDAAAYLGNFPVPVVRENLTASLPGEIPNRFLLWGTYSLPHKFSLIPKFEYRNGFPYQPLDVFQQCVAWTGAQPRFPRYFSMDLRISKDLQVSAKHAIRLSGTVLNMTDHFNPLEVHANLADPLYGAFFGNYDRKLLLDFDFLY
jgi:hypothetical protein